MDYENIKAMIEARMKQWQEQAVQARSLQAEMPITNALEPIITALEACVTACTVILQDLATFHDILQAQVR